MFTFWLEKFFVDGKTIDLLAEKIAAEKAYAAEYDTVILGNKAHTQAAHFTEVVDFDVFDMFASPDEITVQGKDFRRMFFPRYILQAQEEHHLLCKKGLHVSWVSLFLVLFCVIGIINCSETVWLTLPFILGIALLVFFNSVKTKEEFEDIDLLMLKILR